MARHPANYQDQERHRHQRRKQMRRAYAAIAGIAIIAGLAIGAVAPVFAQDAVDPSIGDSLKGKKVLVSPYWLDAFGTASSSWITRLLQPYGIQADAVNPNGTASKQQDELSTAIANHSYDVIVWQPVDSQTAAANIKKIQDAKIPQVVEFASPGIGGLNYAVA